MKSLLEAVLHMHERGVAHRDLKPDNILMDPTSEGTSIKIIDFGVSAKFKQYQSSHAQLHVVQKDMWTRTGNYLYCAPEIFEGAGYTEKIDMWACGVIMYQCLFGRLPFYEDSIFSTIEAIRMAQVALPDSASKQAKDILRRFLNADPLARVTAESISIWITYQAALQHPWFYSVMKPTKVGVPTSENRLEFHDDQDSPRKQQAYFDRNKFARSNTILITSHSRHKQVEQPILEKELSSEGSPPTKHELKFSVVLSKEDSDSDSASSPLMKISKLNQLIDKEIHIKKKPDQKFGEGFLKSKLAIRLSQMQEDNEQPKSQVFDDVIE